MTIRFNKLIAVLLAAFTCNVGFAVQADALEAPVMTMGRETPPPRGFLDLCRRDPVSCSNATDAASIDQARRDSEMATQNYWLLRVRSVQAPAAPAAGPADDLTAATPPPVTPTPDKIIMTAVLQPMSVSDLRKPADEGATVGLFKVHWPRRSVSISPDRPFVAWLKHELAVPGVRPQLPEQRSITPTAKSDSVAALDRSSDLWRSVEAVNRAVNRSIRSRSDQDLFGREDVWQTSSERAVTEGDCEDFVIEKRRRLLAAGLDGAQMSIALVQTGQGQSHAVLLVATDEGEYVLDSLSPWVVAWNKSGYRWISRQARGTPLRWVSLDT